jgi:transaldolase
VLEQFAEAGVDYDDVVKVLEDEGVKKFADSFKEVIESVAEKRHELVAS